jgi:radical SAM protein with 4Fe4S-binding SPASM domain
MGIGQVLERLTSKITESEAMRLRRTHPQPETSWPKILQFEPTGICNLRCTMCPTTYWPTNKTMDPELIEAVLQAVPHCTHVIPYFGGEPFVYGKMVSLIQRIRLLNPNCYLGFNTNATLIDDEKAAAIVENNVTEVVFSVDGATAPTYNAIRVRGNFDDTIENIRRVVRARGERQFPQLGILLTATRRNFREIPDLVRLARDLKLNRVMINGTEPYDEATAREVLYSHNPDPEVVAIFEEAEQLAREFGLEMQRPELKPLPQPTYCPSLSTMVIRADGEVYACAYLSNTDPFFWLGEPRRHMGPLSFGNIRNTSIQEIWNSPRYLAFRDSLRTGKFHPECKQCLLAHGVTCNAQIFPLKVT